MNEIRPIDYAGFVPDETSGEPREDVASDSRESHEILLNPSADYDRGYRDGYEQALLKLAIAMLERASIDATALREQLEQRERPAA